MFKKIVIQKDDPILLPINETLNQVSKKVAIIWALECAKHLVTEFESVLDVPKVTQLIQEGYLWASGTLKMPIVKKTILEVHQLANEAYPNMVKVSLLRAIAHATATIHSKKHAIGLVLYGYTAYRYLESLQHDSTISTQALAFFYQELKRVQQLDLDSMYAWAPFIK